ncbi:MAG: SCP2 sterol-binding domain-containing protein [Bdellovibrionales bacterium]|nr:SCP2 sterol-binding domain-containing protein [Bdellovibrionales bacterium]
MNGKEFFDKFLTDTLVKNPGLISAAGFKSQSVSVDIDGATGGQWTVNFDGEGHASLSKGISGKDCVIAMNEKTWSGLIDGGLNVPLAVMTRKIKIKGDVGLAAKLGIAIKKLSER